MVAQQLVARGIRDERVLAVMAALPRERFMVPERINDAYADSPQPLPGGQTLSQPYSIALMLQGLALTGYERVLEIGTGSGYGAVLLSRLAKWVYGIERLPELVAYAAQRLASLGCHNVLIEEGDGSLGWPEQAPFDAIVVAASGPAVPQALRRQLALGGRLVMPVGPRDGIHSLVRLVRGRNDYFRPERLADVRFVPLVGAGGWRDD